MANYEDEDVIYIDIHILAGVGTDADSETGSPRSVETGAEFDCMSQDCSRAGVEDEIVAV